LVSGSTSPSNEYISKLNQIAKACDKSFSRGFVMRENACDSITVEFIENEQHIFDIHFHGITPANVDKCDDIASEILDVLERIYWNQDIEKVLCIVSKGIFYQSSQELIKRFQKQAKESKLEIILI
jgi:hypothetical protein